MNTDGLWIKAPGEPPAEGWVFKITHADKFVTVKAGDPNLLYGEIIKTCTANGWPAPTREEVERRLCETLTIDCRVGREPFPNKFTKAVPDPQAILNCRHRGERLRTEECPTCGGKISAIINRCTVHGEATLFEKPIPNVEACILCRDAEKA